MFCYAEDVMMDKKSYCPKRPHCRNGKSAKRFLGIVAITLTGETVFLILFYRVEIFKE